jgi:hypothetical protein
METKLTFDLLPVIGVLVVLLAWYIPGFKNWYETLVSEKKQLFMVGLLLVVVVIVAGLSALGFLSVYVGPTWKEWVWFPLVDFVIAVIANAGVYKATNYILGGKKG